MTKPRAAIPSLKFVDEYCAIYRNLFPDVRSFESFRDLHLGMISEIKKKSLSCRRCLATVQEFFEEMLAFV